MAPTRQHSVMKELKLGGLLLGCMEQNDGLKDFGCRVPSVGGCSPCFMLQVVFRYELVSLGYANVFMYDRV